MATLRLLLIILHLLGQLFFFYYIVCKCVRAYYSNLKIFKKVQGNMEEYSINTTILINLPFGLKTKNNRNIKAMEFIVYFRYLFINLAHAKQFYVY